MAGKPMPTSFVISMPMEFSGTTVSVEASRDDQELLEHFSQMNSEDDLQS
jgi:hypothetical protein